MSNAALATKPSPPCHPARKPRRESWDRSSCVGAGPARRELPVGMPGIERIRLEGLLPPPVSHYCDAVRAGDILYISGMVAMDRDGRVVGKGDARRQAEQIFENIKLVLDHVGIDFSRITSVLVHLT